MKGRGLVVVLALVLATLATAGVFLYANGVKEEAASGGEMAAVVVSKVDIPANADLNELIKQDQFKTIQVPKVAVVEGAITSIDQLRDKRTSLAILAGEQIPVARIQGEGTVPGGTLGIPDGHQAITVAVEAPRAVAGAIGVGDHLAIYATFSDISTPNGKRLPTTTTVLVPSVEVLRVYQPISADSGAVGAQVASQGTGAITMTLALTPLDTARMVFTLETASVYFALLPPNSNGTQLQKITLVQVIK